MNSKNYSAYVKLNEVFYNYSTYNEEKDIDVLLNSILQQSFKAYEIIFIDGDSKDNTLNKLEIFKKIGKVNLFRSRFDRNRGRNFGLEKVKEI